MSDIRRYIEDGTIYFITSVTYKRKPIFKDPKYANLLLATIEYFKYYLEYIVYGYVVMLEHFHLLIQPSEKYNISKVMNYIKGNFARRYNEIILSSSSSSSSRSPLRVTYGDYGDGREGRKVNPQVWQRRFYDEIIRNEKDFINKLNYIHYNPVKAGLVERAEDYKFSSYQQYYGIIRGAVQVAIEKSDIISL